MAAQPILGVSKMRTPLLDYLSIPTRRRTSRPNPTRSRGKAGGRVTLCAGPTMNTSPSVDDEDDEVLEEEEFDEDSELDEDDEDTDVDDEDEDETWQVVAS